MGLWLPPSVFADSIGPYTSIFPIWEPMFETTNLSDTSIFPNRMPTFEEIKAISKAMQESAKE